MFAQALPCLLLTIGSYFLGSINSAILLCKMFGLPDPREIGSKNPGATNVSRIAGKKIAAFTFIFDLTKGLIPILIAKALAFTISWQCIVGLAAFIGHLYPIFFQFKGGKGVATLFGVLLGLAWPLALLTFAVWGIVMALTRLVALASIIAAALAPVIAYCLGQQELMSVLIIMAIFTIVRHRTNIKRMIAKTERQT